MNEKGFSETVAGSSASPEMFSGMGPAAAQRIVRRLYHSNRSAIESVEIEFLVLLLERASEQKEFIKEKTPKSSILILFTKSKNNLKNFQIKKCEL